MTQRGNDKKLDDLGNLFPVKIQLVSALSVYMSTRLRHDFLFWFPTSILESKGRRLKTNFAAIARTELNRTFA